MINAHKWRVSKKTNNDSESAAALYWVAEIAGSRQIIVANLENGRKAQTDATYNAAIKDDSSVGDAASTVVLQLWEKRISRALRAGVLAASVYQLAVCSTSLVARSE